MSNLFENIKSKLYHGNGVSVEEVIEAEDKLGIRFNEEYRNYLLEYGVVSFGSHEILGLGGDTYLDVVQETLRERVNNQKFPKNYYVIENLGIDGILILQEEEGNIFEWSNGTLKRIYDSMGEYMDSVG